MRVLLINQTFYPDIAATAQHAHDLARHLVAEGHEVTAIASRSIYGEKGAALPSEEVVDGIRIVRVGASLFGKTSIAARLFDFGMFYARAFWSALRLPRQDVVVCFTTPPFIALIGWFMHLSRRTKFVYWVMDLYPDVAVACGVMSRRSPVTWMLERLNRFCLRHADRVVVLGRCMRAQVLAKGVRADHVETINVWSDPVEVGSDPGGSNRYRDEWKVGDRLLVMYSGNFGIGHDVRTIAAAVEALRDETRVLFAFVGGGKRKDELLESLRMRGLSNFVDAPYQPRARLDELLGAADVHLASLARGATGIMVPSKIYGVLAAGRPLVYVGEADGEAARVVVEERCGIVIAPGDAKGLAGVLRSFASDRTGVAAMGGRARQAMLERWGAPHAMRKWLELLKAVVTKGRR